MEVAEHFYADDPSRGPVDGKTTLEGVDYFFLGNGLIQAAVQVTPAEGATPVGLLVMDPEKLGPKRTALTFDAESGLKGTSLTLNDGRTALTARGSSARARWVAGRADPRVEVAWRSGGLRVTEVFRCPDPGSPRLLRQVLVAGPGKGASRIRVTTGVRGRTVEAPLTVRPGSPASVTFEYRLLRRGGRPSVTVRPVEDPGEGRAPVPYWADTAFCRASDPVLERFFAAAKFQLRAAVAASGRLDGGIWQYNLEWVRDQSFIAMALVLSGQPALARTMLARLLTDFVSDKGATADSSRFRPWQESEFDQNGILLFALGSYLDWTGDRSLVEDHWKKIQLAADFPLRPEFRHAPSGLLANRREFWERHEAHGLLTGLELAHQLYVAMGLRSAGRLARLLGRRKKAADWEAASAAIREALLRSPGYSLVDKGAFIKRRQADGRVQEELRPQADSTLPRQTPLFEAGRHLLDPDTSSVLPVAWEFVDPGGRLAGKTLASMETLWDQRWTGGGYGRYNVTSEPDSPGPWPFASLFVARAAVEAGQGAIARRILDWLARIPGGRAGSWFEFYGPRPVPPYPQVGIIPWTWAELVLLVVHHLAGLRPAERALRVRPRLLPGLDRLEIDLPVRGGRLELSLRRARGREEPGFRAGSRKVPYHLYGAAVPVPEEGGRVAVRGIIP